MAKVEPCKAYAADEEPSNSDEHELETGPAPPLRGPSRLPPLTHAVSGALELAENAAQRSRRLGSTLLGAREEELFQAVMDPTNTTITAIEVVTMSSYVGYAVLFLGGLAQFESPFATTVYLMVWCVCFFLCGGLCCANVYFQEPPHYNLAIDGLSAYCHLPAFLSLIFWRRMLKEPAEGNHSIHGATTSSYHTLFR